MKSMIQKSLINILKETFKLDWQGIHGLSHWARVRVNGLLIARQNGADPRVIELFAFFHDSQRQADWDDDEHGQRAAVFVDSLSCQLLGIDQQQKQLLKQACADHSKGFTQADVTVQTCWDADRLDLARAGHRPSVDKLCTNVAKQTEFIEQAYQRANYQYMKLSHEGHNSITQDACEFTTGCPAKA